jgi:hypothetical protein
MHERCSRPTLLTGKQDAQKTPSSRVVLKTLSENAGAPAALEDVTHGNVTLDNVNSVDKVVEDTVKGQDDKLEEAVASLNLFLGSYSQKISKLNDLKARLAHRNDRKAQLATTAQELVLEEALRNDLKAQLATKETDEAGFSLAIYTRNDFSYNLIFSPGHYKKRADNMVRCCTALNRLWFVFGVRSVPVAITMTLSTYPSSLFLPSLQQNNNNNNNMPTSQIVPFDRPFDESADDSQALVPFDRLASVNVPPTVGDGMLTVVGGDENVPSLLTGSERAMTRHNER